MPIVVPTNPVISAKIRPHNTGELTILGISRPLAAESSSWLRGGIIARCATIARQHNRPIRLHVEDVDATYDLAVHPDAYVEQLELDWTIEELPPDAPRPIGEGRCYVCRRMQPLKNQFCMQCGTVHPHDVELRPRNGDAQNV